VRCVAGPRGRENRVSIDKRTVLSFHLSRNCNTTAHSPLGNVVLF